MPAGFRTSHGNERIRLFGGADNERSRLGARTAGQFLGPPPPKTPSCSTVSSEGRSASRGSGSVAWISDTGGRTENQDRALAHIHGDGSWLIAVADGMGGHPRARDAGIAAIRGLPSRIGSVDEMYDAFREANDRVVGLRRGHLMFTFSSLHMCPAATLCVAASTPDGGLLVGHAGDTLPVLLWSDNESWHGRLVGFPHRNRYGSILRYVGAPTSWPQRKRTDRDRVDITAETDIDPPAGGYAIAVVSDGVWEPILYQNYPDEEVLFEVLGELLPSGLEPGDCTADIIASRIMAAARAAGLDDNATVAVAYRQPDSPSTS